MATLSVLVMDLGGVLLPFVPARRIAALQADLQVTAQATEQLMASGIAERLDLGSADSDALAVAMTRLAGKPVDEVCARALWLSVFTAPNLALWAFVAGLRPALQVVALSDNPAFVADVFPRHDAFDRVFWSADLGLKKPSAAVFAKVTETLGVDPEAIVFVDDSAPNVVAAEAFGWTAIQFITNRRLIADLGRRGIGRGVHFASEADDP